MEINHCLDSCSAACCNGTIGFFRRDASITTAQIEFMKDKLKETNTPYYLIHTLASRLFPRFFSPEGIVFKGTCPFLNQYDMCDIHMHVLRPLGCSFTKPGGRTCTIARLDKGLHRIQSDNYIPISTISTT